MTKRDDEDADDGVNGFRPVVRHAQRAGHHAKAEPADCTRHHEPVLRDASPERNRGKHDGERKADFVNDRSAENAAGRRHQSK